MKNFWAFKCLLRRSGVNAALRPLLVCFAVALSLLLLVSPAHANVYATNIRLNGGTTNVTLPSGGSLAISYFLNETATAGVIINLKSGAAIVRTISIPGTNSAPGTVRGPNTVTWDGRDNAGNIAPGGDYAILITAAATGSSDWIEITSESDTTNHYVWEARGIAVNKNTNSSYYGRVFIGNAQEGPNPDTNPGDKVGIQKRNADGSAVAEGLFSDGGYDWAHGSPTVDFYSPWKIEVSDDDRVYVSDAADTGHGLVLSFDQTISSNSLRSVLRSDNWPNPNVNLRGSFITGAGTNTQVWMADATFGGIGIRRWNVATNGTIGTNNAGTTLVQSGASSDLNGYPYDVAVDRSNRIYAIQQDDSEQGGTSHPGNRVLRFPAYAETPGLVADWKIGTNDDTMINPYGLAVDPTGNYVAVAFRGGQISADVWVGGSARVFYASNGAPVTAFTTDQHTDVAWDNAGNLYATDNAASAWHIYSPPGTNQATTAALQTVHVQVRPVLSQPVYSGGQFHFTLTGEPNVTYIIYASTDLQTWVPVATNNSVFATRPISVTAPPTHRYFQAGIGPYSPAQPVLTMPSYAAGQFHLTLIGEGGLSYIIQASTNLQNWVPVATNNAPSATRALTIDAAGSQTFYRALVGH